MNNDYENKYDCDPADCAGYRSDDRNDNGTEAAADFPDIPDEYGKAETADEFGTPSAPAGFFNAPGVLAPIGTGTAFASSKVSNSDLSELYGDEDRYDFEVGAEFDPTDEYARPNDGSAVCGNGCGCGDDCDCPDGSCEVGSDNVYVGDPDDETAATTDWNCSDGCDERTTWAQERCKLDDYEIISDVLGSEKQLVKLYSTALCESAEEGLRGVIRQNLLECADDQYSTFEYMEEHGLYPTEQAKKDQISQAKQQFTPLCNNN